MNVDAIPEGQQAVTPYLVVPDAAGLIAFLEVAFGAEVVYGPMRRPDGAVMHAQLTIGGSSVMLGEPMTGSDVMTAALHLFVLDCDTVHARAVAHGGLSIMEPADQFYGNRLGGVRDPAGNTWWIATHIEDVSPQEVERRMAERMRRG